MLGRLRLRLLFIMGRLRLLLGPSYVDRRQGRTEYWAAGGKEKARSQGIWHRGQFRQALRVKDESNSSRTHNHHSILPG